MRTGTAQHREEKAWGISSVYKKYLKKSCEEDGARLFPVVPSTRTRSSGHKLEEAISKCQEALVCFVDDGALSQAAKEAMKFLSLQIS